MLTCEDNKYLYNGKCISKCPRGTFKTQNDDGQNVCDDCDNYYKLSDGSYPDNCYDNETIISLKMK